MILYDVTRTVDEEGEMFIIHASVATFEGYASILDVSAKDFDKRVILSSSIVSNDGLRILINKNIKTQSKEFYCKYKKLYLSTISIVGLSDEMLDAFDGRDMLSIIDSIITPCVNADNHAGEHNFKLKHHIVPKVCDNGICFYVISTIIGIDDAEIISINDTAVMYKKDPIMINGTGEIISAQINPVDIIQMMYNTPRCILNVDKFDIKIIGDNLFSLNAISNLYMLTEDAIEPEHGKFVNFYKSKVLVNKPGKIRIYRIPHAEMKRRYFGILYPTAVNDLEAYVSKNFILKRYKIQYSQRYEDIVFFVLKK